MHTDSPTTAESDSKRRFLFENLDVRGEIVYLDGVLSELNEIHAYPASVARQLGEFAAAAVLLSSTLKFRGSLTLQARSSAEIPLIMAECSSELNVRAIARGAQLAVAESFAGLLGGGQLALTVTPDEGARYQGIVPLADTSLAASLDDYFSQSEQLRSRFYLASCGKRAAGILLQQLPQQLETDTQSREENWRRLAMLGDTLNFDELLDVSGPELLYRLFHEEQVRLFEREVVRFRCSCSENRTLAALASIGEAEIRSILDEQGSVTMDCEFCNQQYCFQRDDLQSLLSTPGSGAVH